MQTKDHTIKVSIEHSGRRVDNFLLTHLKDIPRSLLYKLLRKGNIRINEKIIKPSYRLQEEDVIYIRNVSITQEVDVLAPSKALQAKLTKSIIYEDQYLMILNKPAGLAVHGGSGVRLGVIETLRAIRPKTDFLELAHRLDRDTSGCLIIAKKRSVLRELHELLRNGKIGKTYYALTLGRWKKQKTRVAVNLVKNKYATNERKVKIAEHGKESLTEFKVLKRFPQSSLVEV